MSRHLLSKGQLQIGESMLVIIIILVLGVFVLVFFAKMAASKYQVKLDEFEDINTIETAQVVNNLYELQCSKTGVTEACVDKHKALALASLWDDDPELVHGYYYELFKNSRIVLREIYPGNQNYTLYWSNATTLDTGDDVDYQQVINALVLPVSIYNSTSDTTAFGVLSIERFYTRRRAS